MDARTLRVLEFDKVLDQLARHAQTSMGRERCLKLRPRSDIAWIQRRLDETEQARRLLREFGAPPLGAIRDIRDLLQAAEVGRVLEPHELLQVRDVADGLGRLRDYFRQGREQAPALWEIASQIGDYSDVIRSIQRAIDDEGFVRDDASEELSRLRSQLRGLESRMRERMQAIVQREMRRGTLQEPLVVQRAGRWCVPVKAGMQAKFQGILHDRSDTGATVFMEPAEVVQLGNRIREVEVRIRQEIERILKALSAQVADIAGQMSRDIAAAGVLDFIAAKAALAEEQGANMPALRQDGYLELRRARHPLLQGEVVPNDIYIGRDFWTLVITGPNTGGKTVALKTAGLLTLMAQAGLHIPAGPTSQVNVFTEVFADIGDEQSIEQSLSTFSSHTTQIVKIINYVQAKKRDGQWLNVLVLLDEIGAGTDPSEGSALARAVLEFLHSAGCRTICTTHYKELKTFAYEREGMENASVEFDVRTLRPTYRLLIGHAGASNALEIAQRLGMPRRLINRARRLLGWRGREVERALQRIHESQKQVEEQREELQELRAELERARQRYEREAEKLRQERERLLRRGYDRALRIVAEAEEQARAILARLQAQPRQSKVTQQLREQLAELRRSIQAEAEQVEAPAAPPQPLAVAEGMEVLVGPSGQRGIVERIDEDGRAVVRVGNIRMEMPVTELRPAPVDDAEAARRLAEHMASVKRLQTPREIDVRGLTVQEAIYKLEKFLDDALLAGYDQVRIIHGKGTGALRQGIHRWLDEHPSVQSYHFAPLEAGGDGATIVRL